MNIVVFTIFPEIIKSYLSQSIIGRALEKNIWSLRVIDIKNYGLGKHKQVDDTPYGGGSGMIMRADVLGSAIEDNIDLINLDNSYDKIIATSPRGVKLDQKVVKSFSELKNLYIITNRFEGIDQRVIDYYKIQEVSIGDYILCGGELAAMVITESVARLLPNVLGNENSNKIESFSDGNNLEHDHYTKPSRWNDLEVPSVLLSGNHREIEKWRICSKILSKI